jgi:hypothetical protein
MVWKGHGVVWSLVNVDLFLLAQLLESNTLLKRMPCFLIFIPHSSNAILARTLLRLWLLSLPVYNQGYPHTKPSAMSTIWVISDMVFSSGGGAARIACHDTRGMEKSEILAWSRKGSGSSSKKEADGRHDDGVGSDDGGTKGEEREREGGRVEGGGWAQ